MATNPKTYVLIHGAWHGGWCWRRVVPYLQAAGHTVFTPTLTGLGERAHLISGDVTLDTFARDVIGVLEMEELTDIILVGHSFGGYVVTAVADRARERLRCLVYLDAGVGEGGKSVFDQMAPAIVAERLKAANERGGGISLPVPPPGAFHVTDPADHAWLTAHLTPHPLATYTHPLVLDHPIGNGLRKVYIASTAPEYAPLKPARDFVRTQPDWTWLEIAAGHDSMVIAPERLAEILLSID